MTFRCRDVPKTAYSGDRGERGDQPDLRRQAGEPRIGHGDRDHDAPADDAGDEVGPQVAAVVGRDPADDRDVVGTSRRVEGRARLARCGRAAPWFVEPRSAEARPHHASNRHVTARRVHVLPARRRRRRGPCSERCSGPAAPPSRRISGGRESRSGPREEPGPRRAGPRSGRTLSPISLFRWASAIAASAERAGRSPCRLHRGLVLRLLERGAAGSLTSASAACSSSQARRPSGIRSNRRRGSLRRFSRPQWAAGGPGRNVAIDLRLTRCDVVAAVGRALRAADSAYSQPGRPLDRVARQRPPVRAAAASRAGWSRRARRARARRQPRSCSTSLSYAGERWSRHRR